MAHLSRARVFVVRPQCRVLWKPIPHRDEASSDPYRSADECFRVWSPTAAGKAEAREPDLAHRRELSHSRSPIYEFPLSFRVVEVVVHRIRVRLLFVFDSGWMKARSIRLCPSVIAVSRMPPSIRSKSRGLGLVALNTASMSDPDYLSGRFRNVFEI